MRGRGQRRVRLAAAATAAAFLLVACSGSDDASPTTVAPVTEPSSSVAEPETTTSTTSTTTSSTTTSTTTPLAVVDTVPSSADSQPQSDTTAPPAPVPTNTIFDPATPEGEVEQATLSNLIAFSECLTQLPNCDARATMRFARDEYAEDNIALIEGWNADGLEIRDPDSWVFFVEQVDLTDDGVEAIVYVCSYDGARLVVPATDTSAEEVVDAHDESNKSKYLVTRIGETWLVSIGETIETVEGRVEGYCR